RTARDLRRVRVAARSLADRPAPPALWESIAPRLAPRSAPSRRRAIELVAAVAAIALVALGVGVAHWFPEDATPVDVRPRYLLLLHDDPALEAAETAAQHEATVAEYSRWAPDLARAGLLYAGDELASDSAWRLER